MEIKVLNIAILLAAGSSIRMNSDIPKQFLKIKGKEIFRYSLETFLANDNIDIVILCINKNHMKLWEPFFKGQRDPKIFFCFGGDTRLESFLLSIKFLEKFNLKKECKIITHDMARPFVSIDIIDKHIRLLDKHLVVNTVTAISDSIAYLTEDMKIEKYIDRKYTYKIQTPQSFIYKEFFNINWLLIDKNDVTDICYLFLASNISIFNLIGPKNNIKITSKDDLRFYY